MKWEKMQTQGVGPEGRFHHTMNFCESGQILVIHGGCSDQNEKVFNDLFLLDIQDLNW